MTDLIARLWALLDKWREEARRKPIDPEFQGIRKDPTMPSNSPVKAAQHELSHFSKCTFGGGGLYYHDGADRAICSCGWKSAAVQCNKRALIALWEIHKRTTESGAADAD